MKGQTPERQAVERLIICIMIDSYPPNVEYLILKLTFSNEAVVTLSSISFARITQALSLSLSFCVCLTTPTQSTILVLFASLWSGWATAAVYNRSFQMAA